MTTQEFTPINIFEQNITSIDKELSPERLSTICLSLASTCIRYAQVERVPRYHETHRENDAEHGIMVAMLAVELAHELRPELDRGLISQYATIHDLVEVAAGDTPTFDLSEQQLQDKHAFEQAALETLLPSLPRYTAQLLAEYESQASSEARFVRAVDKLTPVLVDILGPGSQVMKEDYGVMTVAELICSQTRLSESMVRRFGEDTPEIVEIYHLLGDIFIASFEE